MRRPKIAELPDHLRQEVNHKLLAGETCDDIAEWLNHELEAKTIAAARWGTCYSASNVHRYHANQFQHWIKAQQPGQCADETKRRARPGRRAISSPP